MVSRAYPHHPKQTCSFRNTEYSQVMKGAVLRKQDRGLLFMLILLLKYHLHKNRHQRLSVSSLTLTWVEGTSPGKPTHVWCQPLHACRPCLSPWPVREPWLPTGLVPSHPWFLNRSNKALEPRRAKESCLGAEPGWRGAPSLRFKKLWDTALGFSPLQTSVPALHLACPPSTVYCFVRGPDWTRHLW